MVMETRSRSDHVSSKSLEEKKTKKQSSNLTQKQTKKKNKSNDNDGHSNRCSKNKIFFLAIFVVGVFFTCLFNYLSSWYEMEISCFISSSLLTFFSLVLTILSLHFVFFSSRFRCYVLFYLGLA